MADPKVEYVGPKREGRPVRFLHGIKARDMTDQEYAALSGEDQRRIQASPLYKVRSERKAKEKADAESEPAEPAAESEKGAEA